MATSNLDDAGIQEALQQLEGWSVEENKLHKQYKFRDFSIAIGFLTAAAVRIEKIDHHPEWCNVYNRVTVDLITHDAGGITEKDVALAKVLDDIAAKLT